MATGQETLPWATVSQGQREKSWTWKSENAEDGHGSLPILLGRACFIRSSRDRISPLNPGCHQRCPETSGHFYKRTHSCYWHYWHLMDPQGYCLSPLCLVSCNRRCLLLVKDELFLPWKQEAAQPASHRPTVNVHWVRRWQPSHLATSTCQGASRVTGEGRRESHLPPKMLLSPFSSFCIVAMLLLHACKLP